MEDNTKTIQLSLKTYTWTKTSFIKSEHSPSERRFNKLGQPIIWKWAQQRLKNEAKALALIAERTNIPIPRVISCAKDENGAMHLEVERIDGIECDVVGETCRMRPGHDGHSAEGLCVVCEEIAFANVNRFVESVVLPQLHNLRSSTTGLDNIVVPSPRIDEFEPRDIWHSKKSPSGKPYVMCHGDLSRSNILLDPKTLQVKAIIDWECAGYFPQELELPLWRLTYSDYMRTFQDKAAIQQAILLMT